MKIGIVFDLDGTIIDTMGFHVETFRKAAMDLGIENVDALSKKFKKEIGRPLNEILSKILPNSSDELKRKLMRKKWDYTMDEIDKIKPIRSTIRVIKKLKEKGYPLAVFSSSIRKFVEESLKRIKVLNYFSFLVCAEDVKPKPNPEGLKKACELLKCDSCIYIGDRKVDEETARNAGFEFVYVFERPLLKKIGEAILVSKINLLKKEKVKTLIDRRIREFKKKKSKKEIFKELAFCLLTANYNAEKTIKIQSVINDGFLKLKKNELEKKLRNLGYRYPKKRSEYITRARGILDELEKALKLPEKEAREFLVKKVKGLGYKEASHFLRNCGKDDVAIIDFHIVDVLADHWLIKKPKTLTKKKYLEIERVLEKIAKKTGLKLSELDLYLWYLETGKVLK